MNDELASRQRAISLRLAGRTVRRRATTEKRAVE